MDIRHFHVHVHVGNTRNVKTVGIRFRPENMKI